MASITFSYQSVQAWIDKLEGNIPQALTAAGVSLLLAASKNIIDDSPPLAPWSVRYAAHTKPHQILWLTGTLLRSLSVGGANSVWDLEGNTLKIGSNVLYAAYLNFGYSPYSNPARPFLYVDQTRADNAKKAFLAALVRGL